MMQRCAAQGRKRAQRAPAPKARAPAGGALKQRDAMLSQVRAYQRLRPEHRRALLTDRVRRRTPASFLCLLQAPRA